MKQVFLILISVMSFCGVSAFHIVGGEIFYDCLGGDEYLVTMKMFRDCNSGGAEFDTEASIGVFDGNGNLVFDFFMSTLDVTFLNAEIETECFEVPATVCVEEGVYTSVITLPLNNSGYYITYQRCCRNSTILNISNPDATGATYYTYISPGNLQSCNNAPRFNNFPPITVCLNVPLVFDHSANDPDGNTLDYQFYTPLTGGSQLVPQPIPPAGPPYNQITWVGAFNQDYQIFANPDFVLNPVTGMLTGTPTVMGQYVIGILVNEYENGVLIGTTRRDFQFNVTECPNLNVAAFANQTASTECDGLTIFFENLSQNSSTYLWDFGDGFTSMEYEPTHTYQTPGLYEVILISNPFDLCPDTAIATYEVYISPSPAIAFPEMDCLPGATYSFGTIDSGFDLVDFDWNFGNTANNPTSTLENPGGIIFPPGLHEISLVAIDDNGCIGYDTLEFEVLPAPLAGIAPQSVFCNGLNVFFDNESVNADSYLWDFGYSNGFDDLSIAVNPNFEYPEEGIYEVTLIASGANTCPDTVVQTFEVYPYLFAYFESVPGQCLEGNNFNLVAGGQFDDDPVFNWNLPESSIGFSQNQNPINISYDNAGVFPVTLTIFENGCESSFASDLLVIQNPIANFTVEGSGCVPLQAYFINNSVGGSANTYLWNFGDGSASSGQSPGHFYTSVGTYDVTLTVNSTGECVDQDVYFLPNAITANPTPEAGFFVYPHGVSIIDPEISVTSLVSGVTCEYYIADQSQYYDCDFIHTFSESGTFQIQQIVINEYGCRDSEIQSVVVSGHLFFAPNAITMNGDGLNDYFRAEVTGAKEYKLELYNRWGEMFFETDSPEEFWIPEYAHQGVYLYKAKVVDYNNQAHIYQGHFVLIR